MRYVFKATRQEIVTVIQEQALFTQRQLRRPLKSGMAKAYKRLFHHDSSKDGSWGIQSTWYVRKDGDGYIVTIEGPRLSLKDWCPDSLMKLAHEAWLNGRTIEYDSMRTDVSPKEYGLMLTKDEWPWSAECPAGEIGAHSDAEPGARKEELPRQYGQLFKEGAFAKGY